MDTIYLTLILASLLVVSHSQPTGRPDDDGVTGVTGGDGATGGTDGPDEGGSESTGSPQPQVFGATGSSGTTTLLPITLPDGQPFPKYVVVDDGVNPGTYIRKNEPKNNATQELVYQKVPEKFDGSGPSSYNPSGTQQPLSPVQQPLPGPIQVLQPQPPLQVQPLVAQDSYGPQRQVPLVG